MLESFDVGTVHATVILPLALPDPSSTTVAAVTSSVIVGTPTGINVVEVEGSPAPYELIALIYRVYD